MIQSIGSSFSVAHKCECGRKLVQIPMIERLQDAIAYELLRKKSLLIGADFRFLRKWVGLTSVKLASALGFKSRVSLSRWENGKEPITAATDHAMRLLVMRIKEQAIDRRMFESVQIEEYFEKIVKRKTVQPRITIDKDKIENLPFPALPPASCVGA